MTTTDDRIAEYEAAPDCEESLRERVARAIAAHEPQHHSGYQTGEPDWFSCGPADDSAHPCGWASKPQSDDVAGDHRRHVADAVIRVICNGEDPS